MNLPLPAAWTAALVIILRKVLEEMGIKVDVKKLCERLGVGRTTAYMAKEEIEKRLNSTPQADKKIEELQKDLHTSQKDLHASKAKLKEQEFLTDFGGNIQIPSG